MFYQFPCSHVLNNSANLPGGIIECESKPEDKESNPPLNGLNLPITVGILTNFFPIS